MTEKQQDLEEMYRYFILVEAMRYEEETEALRQDAMSEGYDLKNLDKREADYEP